MAQDLENIVEGLLTAARAGGATAADVVAVEGDSLSAGVRLGEVEKLQQAREKRLGLRVFVDDRSAVASTADFSRASLHALAEDTCALAKVMASDEFAGLPDAAAVARDFPDLDLLDEAVAEISAEQAVAWAKEAEDASRSADGRIQNSGGARCHASTNRVVYASTAGFTGSYASSSVSLSTSPIATDGESMQRDYWYSVKRRVADLDSPESIGLHAARRTLRRLGARSVATCEVPVVFDPEMASGLLGNLASAVAGDSVYRGTSFLIDKVGERIAPEFVNVIDDGRLAGGLGAKPFDAEGLATRRNVVVENGILRTYLCDTYSARRLGCESTANASRSVGSAPYVSPTNFILEPGDVTPDALISSIDKGLYVTELIGFGINAATGDYSQGASGLWIENGEFAHAVEEVTVAGNLLGMFGNIAQVANDLELRGSVRAPTLVIAGMTVGGR